LLIRPGVRESCRARRQFADERGLDDDVQDDAEADGTPRFANRHSIQSAPTRHVRARSVETVIRELDQRRKPKHRLAIEGHQIIWHDLAGAQIVSTPFDADGAP
jgi:hypothetical protein